MRINFNVYKIVRERQREREGELYSAIVRYINNTVVTQNTLLGKVYKLQPRNQRPSSTQYLQVCESAF